MSWFKKKDAKNLNQRLPRETTNRAVFSYYSRGASGNNQNTGRGDNTGAKRPRKVNLKFGHVPSYIAFIAIVVALGYSSLLQSEPKIVIVNANNTVHRESKVYQSGVQNIWSNSIFNRLKFAVNTKNIHTQITDQFPELSKVEIELPLLGKRPTVVLTPGVPAMQFISVNGSFYVNNSGKVMAKTSDLIQNTLDNTPIIRDETGITADTGKNIVPSQDAEFLLKLYAQLSTSDTNVEMMILPQKSANEVDVKIANQSYLVKFSFDSDPRQAVGAYNATKSRLAGEGVVPSEYIDVRVEEKVFYK